MDARSAALQALTDLRESRRTARQIIDDLVDCDALPDRDRPFAAELVHGVIRHRFTLAAVLSPLTRNRWQTTARRVQHILMLGAYQIVWLDHVPVFAAVNEAVNQAKAEGGTRTGQFVNAVLRQLERQIEHRRLPASQADPTRAIPVDLATVCQFSGPLFADPEQRPVDYLSQATSHPGWLVARWMDAYGPERTRTICLAGMLRPPVFLRPNRLKVADITTLVDSLAQEGFEPYPTVDGKSIVIAHAGNIGASALLQSGMFQPQDPTALLPVARMNLQPGQVVLDLCAGLGTKATQIAEALGNDGQVIATDVDTPKLSALADSATRMGHPSIQTVPMAELPDRVSQLQRLDWILIDAPCSNTGVLARRPEVRYRLTIQAIAKLADTQLGLLNQAAGLAGPQTRLMYSTCSIDPEENEQVCSRFLQTHDDWRLADNLLTLPCPGPGVADWHDGGYWAILSRR